jgi:hypothetical protein
MSQTVEEIRSYSAAQVPPLCASSSSVPPQFLASANAWIYTVQPTEICIHHALTNAAFRFSRVSSLFLGNNNGHNGQASELPFYSVTSSGEELPSPAASYWIYV